MVQPSRWPRVLVLAGLASLLICGVSRAQASFSPAVAVWNNINDYANTPQVAVDATGNIYVVWEDDLSSGASNNILFSELTKGATTWSTPYNISNDANSPFNPRLVVDSQGYINVVWLDGFRKNNVYFSRSTDGGASFSSPVNVANSTADAENPQLAVDSTGTIHVVWANSSVALGVFYMHSTDGGQTFSTPFELTLPTNTSGSYAPQLTTDASGNVYVVWDDVVGSSGQTDVYFSVSKDNGNTFSPAQNLSNDPGSSTVPQIALDSNGNINVVWVDSTPGNDEIFFSRSTDQGTTFSAPKNVSNNASPSTQPLIGADTKGNVFIVWQDIVSSSRLHDILFVSMSNGATSFSAVQNLSQGGGDSVNAWMTVDALGRINVAWEESITSQPQIFFAQSKDSGASFAPPTGVSADSGDETQVEIAGDNAGNLDFVWSDDNNSQLDNVVYFSQLSTPNQPPVANAGTNQTVTATSAAGASVTLDGSASSDPNGQTLTFVWSENGNVVGNGAVVTLTASIGAHTYTLTVKDTSGLSSTATTNVTVNDAPPVANAGADQTVTATGATTAVKLNGTASSDVDGATLTYSWMQGSTVIGTTAIVPVSLNVGTYTFTLTVTDPAGLSSSATTHVTVNNATPVAQAGADQTLAATGPTTPVTLNGSGSDVDGGTLTFSWSQNGAVVGNTAVLALNLNVGSYTFTLTVTDGTATATSVTHVTINNAAPVVNAGANQTLTATGPTTPVTLNGSGSDVDGGTLSFSWSQNGTAIGNTAVLPLNLNVGSYTFTLTVTDGTATATSVTQVTIKNATPVANAGADQTLTATGPSTPVTLNGSGSDVDGGTLSFSWSQNGAVVGNTAVLPLSLKVGSYTFTLTVTDGSATSTAVTHVTINDAVPVANAGADQTLTATGPTTPVTLNGSGSDVDGGTLSFSWSQNGAVVGNTAVLPLNLNVGSYTFTLTVTDGTATASSVTHVTVNNAVPVANAGANQTLTATGPTTPVTLNGSGSDVDGGTLSFSWSQNGAVVGNTAVLPLSLKVGSYTFTLTVTDGTATSTAVTHVTVNNAPPVANAGADQSVTATSASGAMVTLNGSATDPDGDAMTFVWTEGSTVLGKSAVLSLTASVGTHTYTLTVTDAGGLSSSAVTHVTVAGQMPVAVVVPDPTLECTGPNGTLVTLDGSASTGPGLTYVWTENNTIGGSIVVGRTAKVQVLASLGTHTYTLTVSNSFGSSSASTIVHIVDTTAPMLSFSLSTTARKLHNNEWVMVGANISVSDICDAHPKVKLVSITSNDPADKGHHSVRDIQSAWGGPIAYGTDVRMFRLRVETPENGQPLIYTVTYSATDASGNMTSIAEELSLVPGSSPTSSQSTSQTSPQATSTTSSQSNSQNRQRRLASNRNWRQ